MHEKTKPFVEPEQVFDADRQAHFDAQKKQADAIPNIVAQNLALEILAVKEKKRKADEVSCVRKEHRSIVPNGGHDVG